MIEIHLTISRGKKQFFVRNSAKGNGKILHSSETVKTKASAIKNIKATKELYCGSEILKVKDCTEQEEKIIFI